MNTTSPRMRAKRPYLTHEKRHAVLLEAAADLVETQGWNALTMVSLARHAKVSRQLVYQHFDSVDALLMATLERIFADTYVRTRDTVTKGEDDGLGTTVSAMLQITLELPSGRRRALWQAMSAAGTGIANSEMESLSRRLRHLLVGTIRPLVERQLHVSTEQARPLTWMLIVSFWGALQMVNDGELQPAEAMSRFAWLMDRLARGAQMSSTPVPPAATRRRPRQSRAAS